MAVRGKTIPKRSGVQCETDPVRPRDLRSRIPKQSGVQCETDLVTCVAYDPTDPNRPRDPSNGLRNEAEPLRPTGARNPKDTGKGRPRSKAKGGGRRMRDKPRCAPRAQPPLSGGGHGNQKERGAYAPTENTFGRGAQREKKGKKPKRTEKGFRAWGWSLTPNHRPYPTTSPSINQSSSSHHLTSPPPPRPPHIPLSISPTM